MIPQMIINRTSDWFVFDDINNDPYYFSILLLDRLSTRPKKGLKYDRLSIIKELINQNSIKSLDTLDKAIILLSSRSLIDIVTSKDKLKTTILINDKGIGVIKKFREELNNATSKN